MRTSKINVLVIESPALADITTGFRAGERVRDQLQLMNVPCLYKAIHTADLLTEFLSDLQGHYPYDVLHLWVTATWAASRSRTGHRSPGTS